MMAARPCLRCGAPCKATYCPAHQKRKPTPSSAARGLGRDHARRRRLIIDTWVTAHGWVCPGWDVPPHGVPIDALEADHVLPRSTHPELSSELSNYGVLCRSCNARKGARAG